MGIDIVIKTVTVGFGRRSGIDRRKPQFDVQLIDRRSGVDRRSGEDRRSGIDFGKSPFELERRSWLINPI